MNSRRCIATLLLAAILMMLSGCGSTISVTEMVRDQHMERVVAHLIEQAGFHFPIRVVVDTRQGVNAYSTTAANGQWYIGYTPSFVARLTKEELTGVIAHEIAHLVYRHLGKPQEYEQELESDQWAGWLLYRMGVSLNQATMLWSDRSIMPDEASASHPGREFRVESVTKGWRLAEAQDKGRINQLAERIRSQEQQIQTLANRMKTIETEKEQLGQELESERGWKKWALINPAIIAGLAALIGIGAFIRMRKSAAEPEDAGAIEGPSLREKIQECFGPHAHADPLCRRVWRALEPLFERYDDDAAFDQAALDVLEPGNGTPRLSVDDRRAAMRILLAA